jgi:serpin B
MKKSIMIIAALATAAALAACSGNTILPGSPKLAKAEVEREVPQVEAGDAQTLSAGNAAFALDLYHRIAEGGDNLVYSPYSISAALAMTYAGASGDTASQMADVLHFDLPEDDLHPAFNALGQALDVRNADAKAAAPSGEEPKIQLDIANALWGQLDYPFKQEFLETLARNYGAGVQQVDFLRDPEGARDLINQWAAQQTRDKITDVIPEGSITEDTRLVLANAIYLKARWLQEFEESQTTDMPFTLLDGSQTTVRMMQQEQNYEYAQGAGWQAVRLAYADAKLGMLLIVPDEGSFEVVEQGLDGAKIQEIIGSLQYHHVYVGLPQFEIESTVPLTDTLKAMGMVDAFGDADFSRMTDEEQLAISAVLHKAYIKVYEGGTEAAAVTAVIVGATAVEEPQELIDMIIDRPFLFAIYDNETGAILFVGRVLNPAQ